MKKTFTIIFTALSALLILDSIDIGHAAAMFLLAGVIPGTNIVINADHMLNLFALLLGLVITRVCIRVSRAVAQYQLAEIAKRSRV